MRKIHFIYLGIIAILCIAVGVAAWKFYPRERAHYAVYLASGDLYFGELRFFPTPTLYNAYVLARRTDGAEILKFSDVFWGPQGTLRLNYENVLWTAQLRSEKWNEIENAIKSAKGQ